MTNFIIAVVIIAVIAALALGVTLCLLLRNMKPGPARDLTRSSLEGTRFEKYADTVVPDILELRALPWEDVYTRSFDGLKLHGRLVRGGNDTVILIHGYRSSVENDFAGIAQWYVRRGFTVLAADQRAHGLSEGRRITFGVKEQRDAVAWAQYAEYELDSARILLHGVSMGAVSVLLALRDGYPDPVRGVVADCPFDSAAELVAYRLRTRFRLPAFPAVPLALAGWALLMGPGAARLSCRAAAAAVSLPRLLISAGGDRTVPSGSAAAICEAAPQHGTLVTFPGAEHALCWQEDREKYSRALDSFLCSGAECPSA